MRPLIAAYYFPNYHQDARNEQVHGPGWTEWELVRRATPRWPGHQQPKVPLWGYTDEADPVAMAQKITAAADHGVDAFIFDWYHYDDGDFLGRGLDEGFLHAANRQRMKFALMWANHDWIDIHPAKASVPAPLLYGGKTTQTTFSRIQDRVIAQYFSQPNHLTIDGAPYFSIYELFRLVESCGGVEGCRQALAEFRAKTKAAGHPDLHLNAVVWGVQILPNEQAVKDPAGLIKYLGFDSVTSYVWVHHHGLHQFPETSYSAIAAEAEAHWSKLEADFPVPYHPNVTMGWDASPRTVQSDVFRSLGYPFMATLGENTPAAFRAALERAQRWTATRTDPIITLNAWNEWTEGSYLEPDTVHGYGYLEAIRSVFGVRA